ASHRKPGVPRVLNHTRALIAEHQRRLGSRVSTRQDREFERGDAGGRHAHQYPVLCRLRLWQFPLPQTAVSRERLCFDRAPYRSPYTDGMSFISADSLTASCALGSEMSTSSISSAGRPCLKI